MLGSVFERCRMRPLTLDEVDFKRRPAWCHRRPVVMDHRVADSRAVSTSPKRLPTPLPMDCEWTASATGDALTLEPDAPPHVAGVEQRQGGEHAHVKQVDVLGVLPYRIVG